MENLWENNKKSNIHEIGNREGKERRKGKDVKKHLKK